MIAPLITDYTVDVEAVERLVNHMLAAGCSGIFLMGSSGEGPWLDRQQRETLIKSTVRAAAGRAPILVGVLEPGTWRTLEALRAIEDLGADAVVIASPYYFGADASAQLLHFERVAKVSKLPVVLYNIPPTTHQPIAVETVRAALQFDNVIAIKDSAGNLDDFIALLALRAVKPGFRVFQGAERLALRSLQAGADGLVPGMGNIAPHWFVQMFDAVHTGRKADAEALQGLLDELGTLHSHDYWLVCLKYAASLLGFGSGTTCGHVSHLTEQSRATIELLVKATVPVGD
jgi:4-hydroxy-tetrahydrodipicolinate synthase